jgi:hypothetical protein
MRVKIFIALAISLLSLNLNAQNFPSKESAKSEIHCEKEWTKRGKLDQEMYKFCLDQEYKGYEEAILLIRKYKSQPWIQQVIDNAIAEWTKAGIRVDSMVHFAINQNIDAWEDLVYESKQSGFDSGKFKRCQKEWGVAFNMVSFCYKN